MKKIFLVLILGYAFTAQAQYGYGDSQSRRQNQMMQTEQKAPEPNFDVERYIGIVNYDNQASSNVLIKQKFKLKNTANLDGFNVGYYYFSK